MNAKKAIIITVGGLEDALFERYERDFDVRELLFPFGCSNDCYKEIYFPDDAEGDEELVYQFLEEQDFPCDHALLIDMSW